jgi:hypothetical protein
MLMSKAYDLTEMMTISDMAYAILEQSKKTLHYKEIFNEITKVKNVKNSGSVQSCIYSQDSFVRMGNGYWGLKEWLLNNLSFIYFIGPLEYERNILKINYDYEFYFPRYIQEDELKLNSKKKDYICQRERKKNFSANEFYQSTGIKPGDELLIKIKDINKLEYKIVDQGKIDNKYDLEDLNNKICELACEVLKEKRGIMSTYRLLEQILIKIFKENNEEGCNIGPLLPLSKILESDDRFREKLSGMFALDL